MPTTKQMLPSRPFTLSMALLSSITRRKTRTLKRTTTRRERPTIMAKAHQETRAQITKVALAVADAMVVAAVVVADTAAQVGWEDLGDMAAPGDMVDITTEDLPMAPEMDIVEDRIMVLTRDITEGPITDLQVVHEASVVEVAGAHGDAAASSAAAEVASILRASRPNSGTNSTTP
jgi:hypothetical protein